MRTYYPSYEEANANSANGSVGYDGSKNQYYVATEDVPGSGVSTGQSGPNAPAPAAPAAPAAPVPSPYAGGSHSVDVQGRQVVWNGTGWVPWMGAIPTGGERTTGFYTPEQWQGLIDTDKTNAANAAQHQKDLAAQSTQRTLNLLRQSVGQNEEQGIADLRRELASRGLMDSGSLGAGVAGINAAGSRDLTQGTQAAAQGEGDKLLGILSHSQDLAQRQHEQSLQNSWAQMQFQNNINQFYQQMGLARDQLSQSQRQFYDSLAYRSNKDQNDALLGYLGALGSAVGSFAGSPAGSALIAGMF